jgi:membrane fusion protein (multidrug efflux system)
VPYIYIDSKNRDARVCYGEANTVEPSAVALGEAPSSKLGKLLGAKPLFAVATNPVQGKRFRRTSIARLHTVPIEKDLLMIVSTLGSMVLLGLSLLLTSPAMGQASPGAPPVVGVITAQKRPMAESTEINGRIQASERVNVVARVTAFMNGRLFAEGADVKTGDLLYKLERAPFEADVEVRQGAVAQAQAQLENANVTLSRAQELLQKSAGTQVAVDSALAAKRTLDAQLQSARAQLHQSQINLDYTEIRSPIDGRIGRTSVTIGNVVSPTTGVLTTIVSTDPMYVVFPIAMRRVLELRDRFADKGGFDAVKIQVRLPNGKMYGQVGKLDFVDVNVAQDTDTIILRGTIPNPVIPTSPCRKPNSAGK